MPLKVRGRGCSCVSMLSHQEWVRTFVCVRIISGEARALVANRAMHSDAPRSPASRAPQRHTGPHTAIIPKSRALRWPSVFVCGPAVWRHQQTEIFLHWDRRFTAFNWRRGSLACLTALPLTIFLPQERRRNQIFNKVVVVSNKVAPISFLLGAGDIFVCANDFFTPRTAPKTFINKLVLLLRIKRRRFHSCPAPVIFMFALTTFFLPQERRQKTFINK